MTFFCSAISELSFLISGVCSVGAASTARMLSVLLASMLRLRLGVPFESGEPGSASGIEVDVCAEVVVWEGCCA